MLYANDISIKLENIQHRVLHIKNIEGPHSIAHFSQFCKIVSLES